MLNKHQIRRISSEREIRHTQECRTKPGNVKGDGGHWPSMTNGKLHLGGYKCICDFMSRIEQNVDALEGTSDANRQ